MRLGLMLPLLMVWLCSVGVAAPPVVPLPSSGIGPPPPAPVQNIKQVGSRPVVDRPGIIPHMHWVFGMRMDGEGLLPADESAVVSGKVIDMDHDLPVEDAVVMFHKIGDAPTGFRHDGARFSMSVSSAGWVMTGRDGTFTAQGLEPGKYHIEAYQAETLLVPWLFDHQEPMTFEAGEHRKDVVLKVYGGHSVSGVIQEAESGLPIVGARVGVSRPWTVDKDESGQSPGAGYEPLVTDDTGRFTIHGASGREFRLHVDAFERHLQDEQGRRIHAVPLHPTADARAIELAVDLFPPPVLRGRLVDAGGAPFMEGEVAWQPGNVSDYGRSTDRTWVSLVDDGRFEVKVTQRSYGHLFVRAKDHPLAAYGPFRLDESVPDNVDIRLPAHGSLDLHVKDELGGGVAEADVLIRRTSTGSSLDPAVIYVQENAPHSYQIRVKTEPGGYLRVDGLTPGEYTVAVSESPQPELAPTLPVTMRIRPGELLLETMTVAPYRPFAGRVVDEHDQAIVGAQVALFRLTPQTEPQLDTTDSDGRFHFDRVAPPELRMVRVSAEGFQPHNLDRNRLTGDDPVVVLQSTHSRPTTIRITVRDDTTEELVPDATVIVLHSPQDAEVMETSPGQFVLTITHLRSVRFALVEAPGYGPLVLEAPSSAFTPGGPPDSIDLDARLKAPLSVAGRLVDAATGAPMQDVTVVAIVGASRQLSYWDVGSGGYHHAGPQTTTVNEDGFFLFEGLPTPADRMPMYSFGNHDLLLVFQSHHPMWMEHDISFPAPRAGHHDLGDIAIHRQAPLTVRVTRDGQPIQDALVLLDEGYVYQNRETNSRQRLRQRTNAGGTTTFPWVRSRHVRVRVPSLMLERRITLEDPAAERVVTIEAGSAELELTTTRHGVVHEADITMSTTDGYRVISENPDSSDLKPDSRGLVRIHSLPSGTWNLSISRVGGSSNHRSYHLDFREDEKRYLHVEIEHGTIAARVLDAEGRPVTGVRFAILGREWTSAQPMDSLHDRETDDEGRADLNELPEGTYRLLAWRREEDATVTFFGARDVRVEAGGRTEATLHPDTRRRTVRVRALDGATGVPIPNVHVATSIPQYNYNSRVVSTGTDELVALLEGLPAVPLMVRGWSATHQATWTTVDLTDAEDVVDLDLTMEAGGRLDWRIEHSGEEARLLSVVVRGLNGGSVPNQHSRNYMAAPGRTWDVSTTLPEGDYLAVAELRGGPWIETPVRIRTGETTTLRLSADGDEFRVVEHPELDALE
jgi:hypothetical protein